ncbi:MAG: hypothetical protein COT91_01365 [Candidatus Doudnabacteria bacterium CG10_big_fil_rev_8_21_14_0_10_41_10]|uniref:DUF2207 domain-containing protein n=1 Tax=Candidatus Doudnabacteria bacterium CG10_big_fil_rev_8_21_14_0_10_41_10 TaxID=1974551 RepID=A0A2H0VEB9_9BACT|nr:MAG: hypothetical protein COT91_01365 [Candidatus Doudnabacteria bacterium CG10_big_fil_rev_8_21_14_0_10_41_10]
MKKILPFIFFGLLVSTPVLAVESIESFDVDIKINKDSSVDVTETIIYDFENGQKHGIFRDIPYKYKARGGNFELRLSEISVTDEFGRAYNFEVSNKGDYKSIKIGDADVFVTGQKHYAIHYVIKRALNYFNDYDELYWNATGDEWIVNIANVSVSVTLPVQASRDDINIACFGGLWGSSEGCDSSLILANGEAQFSQDSLLSGEGLTVVVGFPKGLVYEPTVWQKLFDTLKDNGILFLPILIFLIILRLWWTRGRDPQGYSTVVAQYDPPENLTPSEVGTIIDERADNKDVSADIINLAVLGYLKITRLEVKKFIGKKVDYQLDKLKAGDDLKNDFEKKLLESIFGDTISVKLSSLKDKFYKDLAELKKQIYVSTVTKGFFEKDSSKVRKIYLGVGIGTLFIGMWLGGILGSLGVVSFIVSGVIIIGFSFFMPAKTKIGAEARDHILGLKEYLSVAEKDRIKFHNAPEKSPERFEKLLPYAMVLGVEKEWAVQFEGVYNHPPSWYGGSLGLHFSAVILANSLGDFNTEANSTLASSPGSASGGGSGFSGGFSGGGFGGGGGGSW